MGDQPQPPPIKLPIPTIKPFRESPGEVSTDYRQWVKRFGYYLNIVESNLAPGQQLSDRQKNTYFCMHLGTEGLRTFGTNPVTERFDAGQAVTFAELTEAAKEHFAPQVTPAKADFDFRRHFQEQDETTEEFLTSLRILAEDCRFGDQLDRNLMFQLVGGCADRKVQQDLLATPDVTLARVIAVMKAAETAKKDSSSFHAQAGGIHKFNSRGGTTSRGWGASWKHQQEPATSSSCYGCGSADHPSKSPVCPALGKTCNHCKTEGHFASVGLKKKSGQPRAKQGSDGRRGKRFK